MTQPFVSRKGILETEEFRRILALPRQEMSDEAAKDLALSLTKVLKRAQGTMTLRPIQARALHAIGVHGGLFAPMRVGGGKTLVSLLAPYIFEAQRPILLLPAKLIEKTRREQRDLSQHWLIPENVRFLSYQMLGTNNGSKILDQYKPDLLVCDEVQKIKNRKAAVTRRVARYMKEFPETKFVALSGTVMKDSIRDFAHIIEWALKLGAPVPRHAHEVDEWADALDDKLENPFKRLHPGPLLKFALPEDLAHGEVTAARRGFRRRLISTPGVVATQNEQVDCKLHIRAIEYEVNAQTEANFEKLRDEWRTPDDWDLSMATDVWRVANELSAGLHYVWSPRPPIEWRMARSAWHKYVREVLARSRTLDSELQVRMAVARGDRPDGTVFLREWEKQQPTFKINSVPVWHDSVVLDLCARWLKESPGIVWTNHSFFAHALAERAGVAYFGAQGKDRKGREIDDVRHVNPSTDPGGVVASIPANGEGRNLQIWNRNLITTPPPGALIWEQLLGRTHRDGQKAEEVTVDVLIGCKEHLSAWYSALSGAQAAFDTTGLSQKLLVADESGFPDEDDVLERTGWRWGVQEKSEAK